MKSRILPPNSTPLERNLAEASADIEDLDTDVIVSVTRPDETLAAFLPYLAHQESVDRWSDAWPVQVKLQVIKNSFFVHKRKGTIGAIRRVVEPFGYLLEVIEWFDEEPPAPRGTFKLRIGVNNEGITDETYYELERLIDQAKPLSRHMLGLQITLIGRAQLYMGAAAYLGDVLTVYPPQPRDIEVATQPGAIGALHIIDTITVKSL